MGTSLILLQILLHLSQRCLSNSDYDYAYEDNIAMESIRPSSFERFSKLVPESFSGFLHRAGEMLGDSDYGSKIVSRSKEKTRSRPDPGLTIHPNVVQSFLGGKNVDDVQDELKNLLFGADQVSQYGNQTEEENNPVDVDEDLSLEFEEDYSDRRSDDPDSPLAAELRQRPFRNGPPARRRRPFRGRLASQSQGRPSVMRPNSPIRDIRDPGLNKIPGRIQAIPDRFPPQADFGTNGIPQLSHNSISSSFDCDFYTDDLCLGVQQYPLNEIARLLNANRRLSQDMIADVSEQSADDLIDGVSSNQELTYDHSHYFGTRRQEDDSHQHRDFAEEGGFLCPSEIKYAKPKRGKTAQGVWKDIVNVDDYTQTLRMEKCLQPGGSCSYVSHHYKSQCSQVYNYHRLLSWDKERGLHMDIYKVPTCCSCHIMGYSYVYPPLKKQDQSPAHRPPAIHSPPPPPTNLHSSVKPGSFIDFGSSPGSGSLSSTFSIPQRNPSPPASSRPPPPPSQLTPDAFPGPSLGPGQSSDFDNFIPDFDPQEELEAFMNSIGDDFKDFNFERDSPRPARRRPARQPSRPSVGGFRPINSGLVPPGTRGNRRGPHTSIRRGDGFGPDGQHSFDDNMFEDPLHKYESIPLELDDTNFVKKQLNTESVDNDDEGPDSVNYSYHPILNYFAQSS